MFIEERRGPVHAHRKVDGGAATRLFAGAEVSGAWAIRGGNQDMQAAVLSTGEYLVTSVDSLQPARTEVLRWKP